MLRVVDPRIRGWEIRRKKSESSDNPVEVPPPPPPATPLQIKTTHVPIVNQWRHLKMEDLYNQDSSINPSIRKKRRGVYLDPEMSTTDISEMLYFVARFR